MNRAARDILGGVVAGALMVGTAFALRYLKARGFLAGDINEYTSRSTGVITGILVAYLANSIPKTLIPLIRLREPAFAQSLRRFIGITLVIGALLYTATWLFAPFKLTLPLGLASLGGALAIDIVAIAFCGLSQAKR